jgi:hypothetical protein
LTLIVCFRQECGGIVIKNLSFLSSADEDESLAAFFKNKKLKFSDFNESYNVLWTVI